MLIISQKFVLTLAIFFLCTLNSIASDLSAVLSKPIMWSFTDASCQMNVDEVNLIPFRRLTKIEELSAIHSVHNCVWVKINLDHIHNRKSMWVISEWAQVNGQLQLFKKLTETHFVKSDNDYSYDSFSIFETKGQVLHLDLSSDKNESAIYWLRLPAYGSTHSILDIKDQASYYNDQVYQTLYYGFFYGALFAIILHSVFLTIRKCSYITHLFLALTLGFWIALNDGLHKVLLSFFIGADIFNVQFGHLFQYTYLSLIASVCLFAKSFLKRSNYMGIGNKILQLNVYIAIAIAISLAVFKTSINTLTLHYYLVFIAVELVLVSLHVYIPKPNLKNSLVIAICLLFLSSLLSLVLNSLNIIQTSYWFDIYRNIALLLGLILIAIIILFDTFYMREMAQKQKTSSELFDLKINGLEKVMKRAFQDVNPKIDLLNKLCGYEPESFVSKASSLKIQQVNSSLLRVIQQLSIFTKYGFSDIHKQTSVNILEILKSLHDSYFKKAYSSGVYVNIQRNINTTNEFYGDGEAIEVMLECLIDNALQHSNGDTIKLSANIEMKATDSVLVKFCLEDLGTNPLSSDVLDVFESLSSGDLLCLDKLPPHSLGLRVVAEIAQNIGAQLRFTAESDGLTVEVFINLQICS